MPDYVLDSQGSTLLWNGSVLGVVRNVQMSFSAGNVHDVTSHASPIMGVGSSAVVMKQRVPTSVDPGSITASFIGSPGLSNQDVAGVGVVSFSYLGTTLSGYAICHKLDVQFAVGELIQWSAEFQFTGY